MNVCGKMTSEVEDISKYYETLKTQALDKNDRLAITWSKYKNDLEVTKSLVSLICQKLSHNVMVPIGTKALMKGRIVHTNEYLVNLGETWFAKRSAHQTLELCDRRIQGCATMLGKLEKERELIINRSTLPTKHEAFGSDDRPEIIEYVTEQENEEWKKEHKIKEKKYRQQLAELRKAKKAPIQTEEDLWKHLDELELQEELEDELKRLNAESSSEEEIADENLNSELSTQANHSLETIKEEENLKTKNQIIENKNSKRRVSFACDFNSSDDEPLLLKIKHSDVEPIPIDSKSKKINSPGDIYHHHHFNLSDKMPLSVLKNKIYPDKKNNSQLFKYDDFDDEDEDFSEDEIKTSSSVHLKDVEERCVSNISNSQKNTDSKPKKISKFKLYRNKNF